MADNNRTITRHININAKLRLNYASMLLAILAGAFFYGPRLENMPLGHWIASCLVVGGFVALPLLLSVIAAIRPTPARVSWFSFLLLGYLIYGIVLIFAPRGLIAGLMLTGTTLSTFLYAIIWLRPYKKAAKARKKSD